MVELNFKIKKDHLCILESVQQHVNSLVSHQERRGWYGLPQGAISHILAGHNKSLNWWLPHHKCWRYNKIIWNIMEGKHEWQVSMILHWPQNLSTSVANQYKFEFFSWRFTLFLRSVYRDTLVSVYRYVSWPPNIGAPRCTDESLHP